LIFFFLFFRILQHCKDFISRVIRYARKCFGISKLYEGLDSIKHKLNPTANSKQRIETTFQPVERVAPYISQKNPEKLKIPEEKKSIYIIRGKSEEKERKRRRRKRKKKERGGETAFRASLAVVSVSLRQNTGC